MTFDDYQNLARRTQDATLSTDERILHATWGLTSEVGEIMSLFQHSVQEGKPVDKVHLKKEIGDALWFIAELCDCFNWTVDNLAELNIEKLRRRYPDGFDAVRSAERDDR